MGHWRVDFVEGGGGGLEGVLEEYLGLFLAVDLFIGLLVENKRIELSNALSFPTYRIAGNIGSLFKFGGLAPNQAQQNIGGI